MEIIEDQTRPWDGLVEIAFADTSEEAALIDGLLRESDIRSLTREESINGPMLGAGVLTRSARRIYVRPDDAAAARRVIAETMVEDPTEAEIPETVNAEYLTAASGRGPRHYGVVGAYARAWASALVIFAVVAAVFFAFH